MALMQPESFISFVFPFPFSLSLLLCFRSVRFGFDRPVSTDPRLPLVSADLSNTAVLDWPR